MTFDEWWNDHNGAWPSKDDLARAAWEASREAALQSVNCETRRYYGYFCGMKGDENDDEGA